MQSVELLEFAISSVDVNIFVIKKTCSYWVVIHFNTFSERLNTGQIRDHVNNEILSMDCDILTFYMKFFSFILPRIHLNC